MASNKFCPECGRPLTADSPHGLCPQCLMKRGMEPDDSSDPGPTTSAATLAGGFGSVEPTLKGSPMFGGDFELKPGAKFGSFMIERELGRGGMGIVYKAHEESLQRVVALKILAPGLVKDPAYAQRFLREARAGARLQHPNIVPIYAVGDIEGRHYISMAYIKGAALSAFILSRGQLPLNQALDIARQIAGALAEAHEHGVVHRDIKPDNIMLDEAGRILVMDFGLARVMWARTQLTADRIILGTPSYMSPEQCTGAAVDGRTDLYALGVVLFEMLAGTPPFRGDAPIAIMYQIQKDRPPLLQEFNSSVPADVIAVVDRLMAKNPDDRFSEAKEAFDALTRLQGWQRNAVQRSETKAQPRAAAVPAKLKGTRVLAKLLGVAAIAITLLSTVGFVITGYMNSSQTSPNNLRAPPQPKDRTVTFPDGGIGVYGFRERGSDNWNMPSFRPTGDDNQYQRAKGQILVPADMELGITVNGYLTNDLRFLDDLAPDDLQGFGYTNYELTAGDLERIGRLRSMRVLDLTDVQLPEEAFQYLENLQRLKALHLSRSNITSDALKPVRLMPQLVYLSLGRTKIGDEGMQYLAESTRLTYLNIRGCSVTDRGIGYIRNNLQLQIAECSENDITDAGLEAFKDMVNLEVLDLSFNNQISDSGISHLNQLQNLRQLGLFQSKVTDASVAELSDLDLTELSIGYSARERITDASVDSLVKMKNLEVLSIQGSSITPNGLRRLKVLQRLRAVHLHVTDFVPGTMDALAEFPQLDELRLHYGPPLTVETAQELTKLKHLKCLELFETETDDACVEPLSKLVQLERLNIGNTKITPERVEELRRLLPDTEILY